MASAPRLRRRVCAIRRAPDGSAFQKCEACGMSVAVALADMHDCEAKVEVKKFKGMLCLPQNTNQQHFRSQPVSPYRLFMESFMKGCDIENHIEIDRIGFEKWKNMSKEEKQPFVSHARRLDSRHQEALKQEASEIIKVDDEADSETVGKVDESHWIYEHSSDNSEE